MKYLKDSMSHLIAELERIHLLIMDALQNTKQLEEGQVYNGLSLKADGAESLAAQAFDLPTWAISSQELTNVLTERCFTLDQAREEAQRCGISLRLADCCQLFNLSPQEKDILLICLAGEMSLNYQKLFGYLQDDLTKKYPSVDLLLNLLSNTFQEKIALRKLFNPNSTLCHYQLIHLVRDSQDNNHTLLTQAVMLDAGLLNYLLEQDTIDKRLSDIACYVEINEDLDGLIINQELRRRLETFNQLEQTLCLYLQAAPGSGKQTIAAALCRQRQQALLSVDIRSLLHNKVEFNLLLRLALREALLNRAVLYFKDVDGLFNQDNAQLLQAANRYLDQHEGMVILAGQADWRAFMDFSHKRFYQLKIPKPVASERIQLWQKAQQRIFNRECIMNITALAERFQLSPRQIFAAAQRIHDRYLLEPLNNQSPNLSNLFKACREQAHHNLATLAQLIKPSYSLQDIVLPAECMQQLREIIHYVKSHSFVYEQLGFGKKLAMGKGLNALFAGPPGTGKTMAAEIIAGTLELELYRIDLSTVISKYIGETEKNLDKIFNEAESSNVILFFDEADALFSKRTEIKDSHDRHANVETSYLLQRIEAYQGIIILASNFKRNLDEAFVRRLHFSVDFIFPSQAERLQIWQQIWPANIRLSDDVDLIKLANQVELAGGNIRNIALSAAFQAAEDSPREASITITMQHIIHGTLRELKKAGRLADSDDLRTKLLSTG